MSLSPRFSLTLDTPAVTPAEAYRHFTSKLAYETDVADVMTDWNKGNPPFVLLDVRDEQTHLECHIPGSVHVPGRRINEQTTADWDKTITIITYCWGPACNGATKAAAKLASLGFSVKEMLGGIEYWRKEGGQVEGTLGVDAPMYWHSK